MAQSTLFIPDISGFTRFVKTTEIKHSQHIIEELMNLILKEGSKTFEVAEIEGDAVFFFRHNEKLSIQQIEAEAKRMFEAFHTHLLQYKNRRICNCGACSTAVDLKLKFVVHSGEIGLAKFHGGKNKPYGEPVIAVHRLLKTKIGLDQYLLLSDDYLKGQSLELSGDGFYEDKELGVIDFKYKEIDAWSEAIEEQNLALEERVPDVEGKAVKHVNLDIQALHEFILDFKYRHLWNSEAEQVIFDDKKINQVGSEHYCIVDGKDFFFDTIKPQVDHETQLSYGEVLKNPSPLSYFSSSFVLTPESNKTTRVDLRLSASFKWRLQKLMSGFIKKRLSKKAGEMLDEIVRTINLNLKQVA